MTTDVTPRDLGARTAGFDPAARRFAFGATALALAVAFGVFSPILYHLVLHWKIVPDYSHGFLVAPLAVSIAALCEIAVDAAGGGDVESLLASLVELRETEAPEGIEEAEAAARTLQDVLGEPPQLATPERLDAIGAATRRLERELDPIAPSPFSIALQGAQAAVSELQREVEAGYRVELSG